MSMVAYDVKLSELVKAITAGVERAMRGSRIEPGAGVSSETIETAIRKTFGGRPVIRLLDIGATWESTALEEPSPNSINVFNTSAKDLEIRFDTRFPDRGIKIDSGGNLSIDTYGEKIPYIYHRIWAGGAGEVSVTLVQMVPTV